MEKKKKKRQAAQLLDRTAGSSYREEWKEVLKCAKEETPKESFSVVIFRLADEWFALNTDTFREVHECRAVHSVPRRNNPAFRGLVNIRGRLRLCVSLHHLLHLENEWQEKGNFVVIRNEERLWVYRADAVAGVFHVTEGEITAAPSTIARTPNNLVRGIFSWNEKKVALLDPSLLISTLEKVAA